MSFDALGRKVEHGTHFKGSFRYPVSLLYDPQFVILLTNFVGRQVGICNVTFQPVPLFVFAYFVLIYCNGNIIRYFQEFVISALVDVLLGYPTALVSVF